MKAAQFRRYGPPSVLSIVDVPRPEPGPGEVLVRVRATTVTSAEANMRQGRPLWGRPVIGFTRPRRGIRTLGLEFSGVVEARGSEVRELEPGDAVFGFTGMRVGANAEYVCQPARRSLAPKPSNASFDEAAAAVDGATTALFFLRDHARVKPGQRVLVVGASGSIGTYAVQLARHFGAEVSGVCSGANTELVHSLGAHHVYDYTREDFTRSQRRYDVVFDTVGKSSFRQCVPVLTPQGCFVATTGLLNYAWAACTRLWRERRVITGMSVDKTRALPYISELLDAGTLRVVIDRRYPLDDIAEAHRHVDTGHKRGNVVIHVAD